MNSLLDRMQDPFVCKNSLKFAQYNLLKFAQYKFAQIRSVQIRSNSLKLIQKFAQITFFEYQIRT